MEKKSSNGELLCRLCRARASSITSACLILFLAVVASAAQSSPPSPHALGKPQEFTVTVGIYVSAISDIDTNRDSFVADFYVWTYSPASASDPLATVTVARARSQVVLYQWKEKFGDQLWSLRKYRCEIFKNWNVANFPFDRHVIAIAVVPNSDEYAQPRYEVDEKNSGMGNNLALSGWRTENLRVFKQEVAYGSSFGDPNAAGPYRYGVVTASFLLSRKPWLLFFKLMVGAYLAAGAALLGCFMKTSQPPIFSGRMGMQIASLFTAIINRREIVDVLGQHNSFTRLDLLHIAVYVLIFLSLVLTLRSRSLTERNEEIEATRLERGASLCLALFFLVLNVAVIIGSLAVGPNPNILQIIQMGD